MEPYIWAITSLALVAQVALILWFERGCRCQLTKMRSLYVDAKNRERITSQYLEEALESVALPIARDLLVRLSHELDPHRTTREENEP